MISLYVRLQRPRRGRACAEHGGVLARAVEEDASAPRTGPGDVVSVRRKGGRTSKRRLRHSARPEQPPDRSEMARFGMVRRRADGNELVWEVDTDPFERNRRLDR